MSNELMVIPRQASNLQEGSGDDDSEVSFRLMFDLHLDAHLEAKQFFVSRFAFKVFVRGVECF